MLNVILKKKKVMPVLKYCKAIFLIRTDPNPTEYFQVLKR